MPNYVVTFITHLNITVTLNASDEETAADTAWETAEEHLQTITGNNRDILTYATLDGIGHDSITTRITEFVEAKLKESK